MNINYESTKLFSTGLVWSSDKDASLYHTSRYMTTQLSKENNTKKEKKKKKRKKEGNVKKETSESEK